MFNPIKVHELIATGTCRYESYNSRPLATDPPGTLGRSTIELTIKGRLIDAVFLIRAIDGNSTAELVGSLPLPADVVAELTADALALWGWRLVLVA